MGTLEHFLSIDIFISLSSVGGALKTKEAADIFTKIGSFGLKLVVPI